MPKRVGKNPNVSLVLKLRPARGNLLPAEDLKALLATHLESFAHNISYFAHFLDSSADNNHKRIMYEQTDKVVNITSFGTLFENFLDAIQPINI